MYKSNSIKKTIVVAAAAGLVITTSIGTGSGAIVRTVSADQIYSDSTVGISAAFDRYANTLAGKAADDKEQTQATATDAQCDGTGSDGAAQTADKNKTEKKVEIKYPDFKDKCIAVTEDYVNVRAKAGTDSDVVGIIGNNGVATVVSKGKEWTHIVSGNCEGYISNDFLLFGDDAGAYAETNCTKQARIATETLNVREQADVNSDCLTQVGENQVFDILSQDDKWIQIALDDENSGYVSADYVQYTYSFDTAKTMEEIQTQIEAERAEEEAQAEQDAAADQSSDDSTQDDGTGDDGLNTDDGSDYSDDTQYPGDSSDTDGSQDSADDSSDSSDDSSQVAAPSGQTGIDLANFATQFVGNPYVYGGSSLTDGADCSGFVMAVYAQFGYSLPHSAGAQSGYGTRVDTSSLEPGDVLFYGYNGSIEHCAIYIGDGMIVHASTEETGIKISSAFYDTPMCAVRILGQ